MYKSLRDFFGRVVTLFVLTAFCSSGLVPVPLVYAQQGLAGLPVPGTRLNTTSAYTPSLIRGLTVYPDNPLQLNFIVDTGEDKLAQEDLARESTRLIKYFLTALTIPEEEMWVNLSPYEKDRITPKAFGQTEMGKDLLVQDYILKQLTASLMYPEEKLGRTFWNRVYERATRLLGSAGASIPQETFNKVWIVPDKVVIYEHENSAYVVDRHFKVMLDKDYLALTKSKSKNQKEKIDDLTADIQREVLIPEIEREVNEGASFAKLRQVFNSLILAAWFKRNLQETLLGQVYVNQGKTAGVEVDDKTIKQKIYEQYLEAFRVGVYNYIKEEADPATQEPKPRRYFSGGIMAGMTELAGRSASPFGASRLVFSAGELDLQIVSDLSVLADPVRSKLRETGRDVFDVGIRLEGVNPEAEAGRELDQAILSVSSAAFEGTTLTTSQADDQALVVQLQDKRENVQRAYVADVDYWRKTGVQNIPSYEDWLKTTRSTETLTYQIEGQNGDYVKIFHDSGALEYLEQASAQGANVAELKAFLEERNGWTIHHIGYLHTVLISMAKLGWVERLNLDPNHTAEELDSQRRYRLTPSGKSIAQYADKFSPAVNFLPNTNLIRSYLKGYLSVASEKQRVLLVDFDTIFAGKLEERIINIIRFLDAVKHIAILPELNETHIDFITTKPIEEVKAFLEKSSIKSAFTNSNIHVDEILSKPLSDESKYANAPWQQKVEWIPSGDRFFLTTDKEAAHFYNQGISAVSIDDQDIDETLNMLFRRPTLQNLLQLMENDWNIPKDAMGPKLRHEYVTQIDGHIFAPLGLALENMGILEKFDNENLSLRISELTRNQERLRTAFKLFAARGYVRFMDEDDDLVQLTGTGLVAFDRFLSAGVPVSYHGYYRNLVRFMTTRDLKSVRLVDDNGNEIYVDRQTNAEGSDFSHRNYFKISIPMIQGMVNERVLIGQLLGLVNPAKTWQEVEERLNLGIIATPEEAWIYFEGTGKKVVLATADVGSGGGGYSVRANQAIMASKFGDLIRANPTLYQLDTLAFDFYPISRAQTEKALIEGGIENRLVLPGDISKPSEIKREIIEKRGYNAGTIFWVTSMLEHNRPWGEGVQHPENLSQIETDATEIYLTPEGFTVTAKTVMLHYFEFMQGWSELSNFRVDIDLETISTEEAAKLRGRVFDPAYWPGHSASAQYTTYLEDNIEQKKRAGFFVPTGKEHMVHFGGGGTRLATIAIYSAVNRTLYERTQTRVEEAYQILGVSDGMPLSYALTVAEKRFGSDTAMLDEEEPAAPVKPPDAELLDFIDQNKLRTMPFEDIKMFISDIQTTLDESLGERETYADSEYSGLLVFDISVTKHDRFMDLLNSFLKYLTKQYQDIIFMPDNRKPSGSVNQIELQYSGVREHTRDQLVKLRDIVMASLRDIYIEYFEGEMHRNVLNRFLHLKDRLADKEIEPVQKGQKRFREGAVKDFEEDIRLIEQMLTIHEYNAYWIPVTLTLQDGSTKPFRFLGTRALVDITGGPGRGGDRIINQDRLMSDRSFRGHLKFLNTLGPTLEDGFRFLERYAKLLSEALGIEMTSKSAGMNTVGGSKGLKVLVQPVMKNNQLIYNDLPNLDLPKNEDAYSVAFSRQFTLAAKMGALFDGWATDLGTRKEHMSAMLDAYLFTLYQEKRLITQALIHLFDAIYQETKGAYDVTERRYLKAAGQFWAQSKLPVIELAAVTGLPVELDGVPVGGVFGRDEAPGYGIIYGIQAMLHTMGETIDGKWIATDGSGNVGLPAIIKAREEGAYTRVIGSYEAALVNLTVEGFSLEQLNFFQKHIMGLNQDDPNLKGKKLRLIDIWRDKSLWEREGISFEGIFVPEGAELPDGLEAGIEKDAVIDRIWEVIHHDYPVDILISAAKENRITEDNVDRLNESIWIIAEGANNPVTLGAVEVIEMSKAMVNGRARNIELLPDTYINAMGTFVSFLQIVQNILGIRLTNDEVIKISVNQMKKVYEEIISIQQKYWSFTRRDAYDRVAFNNYKRKATDKEFKGTPEEILRRMQERGLEILHAIGLYSDLTMDLVQEKMERSGINFAFDNALVADSVERVSSLNKETPGGIDLNPALVDIEIRRDAKGQLLPPAEQPAMKMDIGGFVPVIIQVTPVNLPLRLGLLEPGRTNLAVDISYQSRRAPVMKKENLIPL